MGDPADAGIELHLLGSARLQPADREGVVVDDSTGELRAQGLHELGVLGRGQARPPARRSARRSRRSVESRAPPGARAIAPTDPAAPPCSRRRRTYRRRSGTPPAARPGEARPRAPRGSDRGRRGSSGAAPTSTSRATSSRPRDPRRTRARRGPRCRSPPRAGSSGRPSRAGARATRRRARRVRAGGGARAPGPPRRSSPVHRGLRPPTGRQGARRSENAEPARSGEIAVRSESVPIMGAMVAGRRGVRSCDAPEALGHRGNARDRTSRRT